MTRKKASQSTRSIGGNMVLRVGILQARTLVEEWTFTKLDAITISNPETHRLLITTSPDPSSQRPSGPDVTSPAVRFAVRGHPQPAMRRWRPAARRTAPALLRDDRPVYLAESMSVNERRGPSA